MTLNEAMSLVEQVKNGEVSSLDVFPRIYEMKKSFGELESELKDFVIDEREKYDKKEQVIRNGYEISIMSRTSYSFSNDDHWEAINQARKNREAMLKKAFKMNEKNQTLTDPETGEIIPPAEVKVSTYPKLKFVGKTL